MSQRIEFLDLAKGICIILVVVYHMLLYYEIAIPAADFFKACRLPLYLFLSGLFFKSYSGFWDFLKRKTNKLLIPFIFWYLLFSIIIPILLAKLFGIMLYPKYADYSIKELLFLFFRKENFPNAPIWFLLLLFEVNILYYCIFLINERLFKGKTLPLCVITLCCGVLGVCLGLFHINFPMYLDSSLSALPFFVFGYYINKRTSAINPQSWDRYNILIALALFVIVYLFAKHYSLKYNWYPSVINALGVFPCGFMGTMGIVLIAKTIKRIPFISMCGRYSIMILVTHSIILRLFAIIFLRIGLNSVAAFSVNLILTIASYAVLIPFMRKFMPHVTAQKDVIPVKAVEK